MHHRTAAAWAAALGASGVILGAFGAHALRPTLDAAGMRDVWDTASRYQLIHAAAIMGFAGWMRPGTSASASAAAWAIRLWVGGALLFAGSLYALALGGPRWLGPVTPLGGAALIAGWALAGIAALRS